MRPCRACGAVDRDRKNHCRPCKTARRSRYYIKNADDLLSKAETKRVQTPEKSRVARRKSRRQKEGWAPGEHERAEKARATAKSCGLCGSTSPRSVKGWVADHSHVTGKFRAILCWPCNIRIGIQEKYNLDPSPSEAVYLAVHV